MVRVRPYGEHFSKSFYVLKTEELLSLDFIKKATEDKDFKKLVQYVRGVCQEVVLTAEYKTYRENEHYKEDNLPQFEPIRKHLAMLSEPFEGIEKIFPKFSVAEVEIEKIEKKENLSSEPPSISVSWKQPEDITGSIILGNIGEGWKKFILPMDYEKTSEVANGKIWQDPKINNSASEASQPSISHLYKNTFHLLTEYDSGIIFWNYKRPAIGTRISDEEFEKLHKELACLKSEVAPDNVFFGKVRLTGLSIDSTCILHTAPCYGESLYISYESMCANIFYSLVKNHIFLDGNKRISAFVFIWLLRKLKVEHKRLTPEVLALLTILVSSSQPKDKDLMIGMIGALLN